MNVGVVKETFPGERRVALVPGVLPTLAKLGLDVVIERGAGADAGFTDDAFIEEGARLLDRAAVFEEADVLCQVRTPGANRATGAADLEMMRAEQVVIGHADPLAADAPNRPVAERGVSLFAMELMPRITRAQSMDVLSSQATVQGYKAVLIAAERLPKMFPLMMTAAGTLRAASVFVIGAGVAGLQAIATSKRLGAVVRAYDIRPAVKEQVESLGGKFLEIALAAEGAEDRGGYAKAMDDSFYQKQQEMMTGAIAESDVVITTAAVPGKKAPVLVTDAMVAGMKPGAVVVDLAAERGGNVEPSRPDEVVTVGGVTILGPTNLAATVPYHASQMYARNVVTFLEHIVNEDKAISFDMEDEITAGTLLAHKGEIVQRRVREILGLEAPAEAAASPAGEGASTA